MGLIAILAFMQLVPVALTNPEPGGGVIATPDVEKLLRRACFDCHSNETVWPWYSKIASLSFALARDVNEGRKELNFSVWDQYGDARRARKKREIAKEVGKGQMPPWYYTPAHPAAKLSAAEIKLIVGWARR